MTDNFAAIYTDRDGITPREAYVLAFTADALYDSLLLAVDEPDWDDTLVRYDLPPIAVGVTDPVWRTRLAQSFADIAARVRDGRGDFSLCECRGDDIALKLTLQWVDHLVDWGEIPDYERIPATRRDGRRHIADTRELLVEDYDIDVLWQPELDGIDVDTQLDLINLHPTRWFLPFNLPSGDR